MTRLQAAAESLFDDKFDSSLAGEDTTISPDLLTFSDHILPLRNQDFEIGQAFHGDLIFPSAPVYMATPYARMSFEGKLEAYAQVFHFPFTVHDPAYPDILELIMDTSSQRAVLRAQDMQDLKTNLYMQAQVQARSPNNDGEEEGESRSWMGASPPRAILPLFDTLHGIKPVYSSVEFRGRNVLV